MNVPMPRDNIGLMHTMSGILFGGGLIALCIALYEKHDVRWTRRASTWVTSTIIFIIAIGIGSGPWLVKNFSELGVSTFRANPLGVLNGSGGTLIADYEKIYTKEEIVTKKASGPVGITNDGQSQNEDMGRYFGYDT